MKVDFLADLGRSGWTFVGAWLTMKPRACQLNLAGSSAVTCPARHAHLSLAWRGANSDPAPAGRGAHAHRSEVAVGSHSTIRAAALVRGARCAVPVTGIRRAAHSFGHPPAGHSASGTSSSGLTRLAPVGSLGRRG